MPKYEEIDWQKAACVGSRYTEIFYNVEEERSLVAYQYINALRTICLACPLWKECLTYAMEHEDYGVWGGMTSVERYSFRNPRKYPAQQQRALDAFKEAGISLEQIMECVTESKVKML